MYKKAFLHTLFLCFSATAFAQSSLYIGAGPSVNHIRMDIAPALIPNFDKAHRMSVNAEVLYAYRFPKRWQVLAGAGMYSIKYGVEAGYGIQPHKSSFPNKYFVNKGYKQFSTLTPAFLSAGTAYSFIQKPYFEVDASLMVDGVYFKRLNLMPMEDTAYETYFLFDQYTYNRGWKFYLQPGIRFRKISRKNNIAYWIKLKGSFRVNSVLGVQSSALQNDNKDYEATISTSGSTFAILAGVELPLSGRDRGQKIRPKKDYTPKRQVITARVGLSSQFPVLVEDSGNMLSGASHTGGYVGVGLEERISGPLYIGIGLTHYTVSSFYKFSLPSGLHSMGSSGDGLNGIPVSIAWYETHKKWLARFSGSLGYLFSGGGNSYSNGSLSMENGDQVKYNAQTIKHRNATLYLDFDVSGSYNLSERFAIYSFLGYSHGFNPVSEKKVTYQFNTLSQETAKINFGLNHLNYGLGLRYAIMKY